MQSAVSVTQVREVLRYDPETGKLFWLNRPQSMFSDNTCGGSAALAKAWNSRYAGNEAFSRTNKEGYKRGTFANRVWNAHKIAWALHYGEWPDGQIDHINGDKADNRIANLRCVSNAENSRNQKLRHDNASGVVGVRKSRWASKWEAFIGVNCRQVFLGSFDTKEAAIAARKAAEVKHGFHQNHGRPVRAHTATEEEVDSSDDAPCTDCGDTGWMHQTERHCTCGAPASDAYDA